MNEIVHLRTYSYFDFLKSTINPDFYLEFLKKRNISVAPLVGYKSVFGLFDFALRAEKNNLKPILGLTIPALIIDVQTWEITVYAQNYHGYQNLLRISSLIMKNLEKTIDLSQITNYLNNLQIVLSLTKQTTVEKMNQVMQKMNIWKQQLYGGVTEYDLNSAMFENFFPPEKMLIFYPVRYLKASEKKIYETIYHIRETFDQKTFSPGYHYWSVNEIEQNTKHKKFIANWEKFTAKININLQKQTFDSLKNFRFSEKEESKTTLNTLCEKVLQKEFNNDLVYRQRYEYELQIIEKHGFIDYFLIVWDYVKFAQEQNILVGFGRGSASGSLISYLLKITKVDPIKSQLLFERFLNPERIDLPDIDLDFEDVRRKEVIEYIFNKYGKNHTAMVCTFQKMGARLAIRDIGRVIGVPLVEINEISKAIPLKLNNDWQKAIDNSLILQKYQKKYPALFEQTFLLIGFPRQAGVHAAGVVISSENLEKLTGTWKENDDNNVIQLDMNSLSDIGLVKMDILGLRNLTLISNLLDKIQIMENKNTYIQKINFEDPKTYAFLEKGGTAGIFQLSSEGMTSLLKLMKPKNIEDIAITISLFRPGPMKNIHAFLQRKKQKEKVTYLYPAFEPILKNTMGLPVFQEQIIQMVQKFVNFNYSQSDILRKAISKKDQGLATQFKKIFFQAAKKQNHSLEITTVVWAFLEKFASYGFNRSHALAYAYISYLMCYFKFHYFDDFMILLLNSVLGDETKTKQHLFEIANKNIVLLLPAINANIFEYQKENTKIRLPILAIKKIGGVWAKKIADERTKLGDFKDIFDFVARMYRHGLSKAVYKQLVFGGVFHIWDHNQATLLKNWERLLLVAKIILVRGETIDWSLLKEKPQLLKTTINEEQEWIDQYRTFGFVWNYQKLLQFQKTLKNDNSKPIMSLKTLQSIREIRDFHIVVVCETIQIITSKKNEEMAFAKISDASATIDVVVFPTLWKKIALTPGKMFSAIIRNQIYQKKIKYFLVNILK